MSKFESNEADKVNWLHKRTLANGLELAISAKSGLVQIKLPAVGRRGYINVYVDELQAISDQMTNIRQYVEDHIDSVRTAYDAKEARKLKPTLAKATQFESEKLKMRTEMVQKLLAEGKSTAEIETMLKLCGLAA